MYPPPTWVSPLVESRVIPLHGEITLAKASFVWVLLHEMAMNDPSRAVKIVIDSVGGDFRACLSILDAFGYHDFPVVTDCVGNAHSGALLILAGGTKGFRRAKQYVTRASLHVPSPTPQSRGVSEDCICQEVDAANRDFTQLITGYTGLSWRELAKQALRGIKPITLSAQDLKRLKIVDGVYID
jgi:ATP-dependent Clp protease protease subunit